MIHVIVYTLAAFRLKCLRYHNHCIDFKKELHSRFDNLASA